MRSSKSLIALITVAVALVLFGATASSHLRVASPAPSLQDNEPVDCRSLDKAFIQFDAIISSDEALEPGRVISLSDGTLAVLLVISGVNEDGDATAVDFAASVRISALIIQSGDARDVREFDPIVRSGSGLRAPEGGVIDAISFCYRLSIPAPPKAATTSTASEQTALPAPSPTALILDLSGAQTASAHAVDVESTATAAAREAADTIATANAGASEVAAAAAAAQTEAASTVEAQWVVLTAQAAEIASARADADAARATADALQATISASPPTATATQTPSPAATSIAYQTSGDTPFADWQTVAGWNLDGAVASTSGTAEREWVVAPVPPGLSSDSIVEIEFRITGGDICPRNFGVGIRGSADGYYAAGIEWGCEPEIVLWSGSSPLVNVRPESLALDDEWHTLRIAAIGNQISVAIDGQVVIEQLNDQFPNGNLVALWSDGVGMEIRAVRVFEVEP